MPAKKVFYCFELVRLALLQSPPLVLCVTQRLVRFKNYWKACFATRRRSPRWLSPFKWLALTSWVPCTLGRHSLFKKILSSCSCHTPQVKPRRSKGRIAHVFSCWTAVL